MKSPKPTTGYLWSAPIQYGVCWKTPGYGSQRKAELKKSRFNPVSRTADLPGQALNVDLCFVPVSHLVNVKLPAVSGSSGHLVVERMKETGQEWDYAGKIFADPELDYAEAVQAFVKASRPLFGPRIEATPVEKPSRQAELQQVRQEEAQLCTERRNTRTRRKLEDAAGRVTWSQQRYEKPSTEENVNPKPRARWGSVKVQEVHRQALRKHHRQQSKQRQQEDEQWRLNRKSLREQITLLHQLQVKPINNLSRMDIGAELG